MLLEVLKYLDIRPNGIYFDCTFGFGGHSFEIYKYLSTCGTLNVFDKDSLFIFDIKNRLEINTNMNFYKCSFEKISDVAHSIGVFGSIDGILVDLGISTDHLLDNNRGFGFSEDGFLDMRLDLDQNIRAVDWLNFASFDELLCTFCFLDNDNLSCDIARAIINFRNKIRIKTVSDFYKIVSNICFSDKFLKKSFNKIFQTIRFFVNNDLFLLCSFLHVAFFSLKVSGVLVLISFNSIEDKIIKNFFNDKSVKAFTSFLMPSIKELNYNYSSKSAVMRIFFKV